MRLCENYFWVTGYFGLYNYLRSYLPNYILNTRMGLTTRDVSTDKPLNFLVVKGLSKATYEKIALFFRAASVVLTKHTSDGSTKVHLGYHNLIHLHRYDYPDRPSHLDHFDHLDHLCCLGFQHLGPESENRDRGPYQIYPQPHLRLHSCPRLNCLLGIASIGRMTLQTLWHDGSEGNECPYDRYQRRQHVQLVYSTFECDLIREGRSSIQSRPPITIKQVASKRCNRHHQGKIKRFVIEFPASSSSNCA